jgi:hypothetical protein
LAPTRRVLREGFGPARKARRDIAQNGLRNALIALRETSIAVSTTHSCRGYLATAKIAVLKLFSSFFGMAEKPTKNQGSNPLATWTDSVMTLWSTRGCRFRKLLEPL